MKLFRILLEIKLIIHFNGNENVINIIDLILPKNYNDFDDIYSKKKFNKKK
jgi:hypothetical protein